MSRASCIAIALLAMNSTAEAQHLDISAEIDPIRAGRLGLTATAQRAARLWARICGRRLLRMR